MTERPTTRSGGPKTGSGTSSKAPPGGHAPGNGASPATSLYLGATTIPGRPTSRSGARVTGCGTFSTAPRSPRAASNGAKPATSPSKCTGHYGVDTATPPHLRRSRDASPVNRALGREGVPSHTIRTPRDVGSVPTPSSVKSWSQATSPTILYRARLRALVSTESPSRSIHGRRHRRCGPFREGTWNPRSTRLKDSESARHTGRSSR